MIEVNKNRTKTDEAWERLYARLDEDNLLAGAGREGVVRTFCGQHRNNQRSMP